MCDCNCLYAKQISNCGDMATRALRRMCSFPLCHHEQRALEEGIANIGQVRKLYERGDFCAAYDATTLRMRTFIRESRSRPILLPNGHLRQWVAFGDNDYDVEGEDEIDLMLKTARCAVEEMLRVYDELSVLVRSRPPLRSAEL